MVRFLHTSDWQMGMKAVHAGAKSKEVREKRYETANKVVDLSKNQGVDFVIIAGDLFEDHNIDNVVVKRTVDILNKFEPIPVYIIPGNHDPNIASGIWHSENWKRVGPHIQLLNEEKEINFRNDVVLYPCPIKQKSSKRDPTTWIPKREINDRKIRIGIAHGSLDIRPDSINFPISIKSAEEKGLDYLALGDWHNFLQQNCTVYSGTFEPTRYDETDSGNVVVVEISAYGKPPNIKKYCCRSLIWADLSPTIHDISDVEQFDKSIKAIGPVNSLILKINARILASLDSSVHQQIETLRKELDETAFHLVWNQETEIPDGNDSDMILPEGILQDVNEALSDILKGRSPKPPCDRFVRADPKVAQKAKQMLYSLQKGGKI